MTSLSHELKNMLIAVLCTVHLVSVHIPFVVYGGIALPQRCPCCSSLHSCSCVGLSVVMYTGLIYISVIVSVVALQVTALPVRPIHPPVPPIHPPVPPIHQPAPPTHQPVPPTPLPVLRIHPQVPSIPLPVPSTHQPVLSTHPPVPSIPPPAPSTPRPVQVRVDCLSVVLADLLRHLSLFINT